MGALSGLPEQLSSLLRESDSKWIAELYVGLDSKQRCAQTVSSPDANGNWKCWQDFASGSRSYCQTRSSCTSAQSWSVLCLQASAPPSPHCVQAPLLLEQVEELGIAVALGHTASASSASGTSSHPVTSPAPPAGSLTHSASCPPASRHSPAGSAFPLPPCAPASGSGAVAPMNNIGMSAGGGEQPLDEVDAFLRCIRENHLTCKLIAKTAWQILCSWGAGARGPARALVAELGRSAENRDIERLNEVLYRCAADRATWSALWKAAWTATPPPASERAAKMQRARGSAVGRSPASEADERKLEQELSETVHLLSCLRTVLLKHQNTVLPRTEGKQSREERIVRQFLKEADACERDDASA